MVSEDTRDDLKRYEEQTVENCSVVFWPGEEYMGHVRASTGTGAGLAKDIFKFMEDKKTRTGKLRAALTDGTRKMTGWKGGAIAGLEELLGRPLQRIICFMHHVELPFGKLFAFHDGPTTGPNSFQGPIGQAIQSDVWKLPVTDFEKIQNPVLINIISNLPESVFDSLNKDHQYLIRMLEVVMTGNGIPQWLDMKAGKVCHARWTNTQSRVLRLYVSTPLPSMEITRLVTFIVKVYAPTFLAAKHFNTVSEGPRLLLNEIKAANEHCNAEELALVQASIQENGFFAHPENVVLSLLSSEKAEERNLGVDTVIRLREDAKSQKKIRGKKKIRAFKVPQINFSAESISSLTDLNDMSSEPPLVSGLSSVELKLLETNH